MRTNGRMMTCDRCGKEQFFKHINDSETDGGFTRWNNFESADGWSHEYRIGDLCPECTEEYERLKEQFKAGGNNGRTQNVCKDNN